MNEQYNSVSQPEVAKEWYVDLNREEFVAFQMLMARVSGPLRLRIPSMVVAVLCSVILLGLSVGEWLMAGMTGPLDMVTAVAGVLILLPGLYVWAYVPYKMAKTAGIQYDRSVSAGMVYTGQLIVTPDFIEKVSPTGTGHVQIDERVLFIENQQMMVLTSAGSPALVLPGRCLTDEMASAVRQAVEHLPPVNRRFIARVQTQGQTVSPVEAPTPEQKWVTTFTYTHEEYTTVLRGLISQHFWRVAPLLTFFAAISAVALGWDGRSLMPCIGYFLVMMAILLVFNWALPLHRIKRRVEYLTAHDMTMQVRMDTLALRVKQPKAAEGPILWCDVDHVYDKEDFVEIVHNKHHSVFIPKRAIDNIAAFEDALNTCRGKK